MTEKLPNRRQFINRLLKTSIAAATTGVALDALAQGPATNISIEGWGLKLPENGSRPEIDPAEHPFRAFGRALEHADLFAHGFLRIGNYDIHGLPTDPQTGARREFDDLGGSILQIFVFNRQDSEKDRQAHSHTSVASTPVILRESDEIAMGRVLDMADALNQKAYPYIPARLFPPPINSNAALGVVLYAIGVCPIDNCPSIAHNFPYPFKIPGINAGTATNLRPGTKFTTMAKNGANLDRLVSDFTNQHTSEIRAGILHKQAPVYAHGPGL